MEVSKNVNEWEKDLLFCSLLFDFSGANAQLHRASIIYSILLSSPRPSYNHGEQCKSNYTQKSPQLVSSVYRCGMQSKDAVTRFQACRHRDALNLVES